MGSDTFLGLLEGNKTGTTISKTTQTTCRVNLRRMLGGSPERKDDSDHCERLFPSSLGERNKDAFLSLNPSEWGAKRVINKDQSSQQGRKRDISLPNRGLLRYRQVFLPLCLPDMGKRVGESAQRLAFHDLGGKDTWLSYGLRGPYRRHPDLSYLASTPSKKVTQSRSNNCEVKDPAVQWWELRWGWKRLSWNCIRHTGEQQQRRRPHKELKILMPVAK